MNAPGLITILLSRHPLVTCMPIDQYNTTSASSSIGLISDLKRILVLPTVIL